MLNATRVGQPTCERCGHHGVCKPSAAAAGGGGGAGGECMCARLFTGARCDGFPQFGRPSAMKGFTSHFPRRDLVMTQKCVALVVLIAF